MRHYFIRTEGERNSVRSPATSYSEALKHLLGAGLRMPTAVVMLRGVLDGGEVEEKNSQGKTVKLSVSTDFK